MDFFITRGPEIYSSILAQTRPQTLYMLAVTIALHWVHLGIHLRGRVPNPHILKMGKNLKKWKMRKRQIL